MRSIETLVGHQQFERIIQKCFEDVFRTATTQPGYFLLDLGRNINSTMLRGTMVEMKHHLTTLTEDSLNKSLNYQRLGRFDQQESTKYHLDNAANQSFLMLGYEPTEIESELYIADYVKFSLDHGMEPVEYFERFPTVIDDNKERLQPYVTKVKPFNKDSFKIVLINNSNCQPKCDTLGVLHMAKIKNPDLEKSRVVNSMMLAMTSENTDTAIGEEENRFLQTDQVST